MMELEAARQRIAQISAPPAIRLPLDEAVGAVLAEAVTALQDIPHAATSAMDGWALAEQPTPRMDPTRALTHPRQHSAEPSTPAWRLRAGGSRTPAARPAALAPGEATEVVTGSPVPEGAISVLRTEHGVLSRGMLSPTADSPDSQPGRNIRQAGAECRAGTPVLRAGAVLTPARAAAAAVAGHDELLVVPRPRVLLILTGEEVITTGRPAPGQVRDVFGVALPSMVSGLGAAAVESHRAGDDTAELVEVLETACTSSSIDVIITSGGTAHSHADPLRPALARLGAELLVDSVNMRPGHPALLARIHRSDRRVHLLGLPGNPLAGFAALTALGAPLMHALTGVADPLGRGTSTLRAGTALEGARRGVRLLPVQRRADGVRPTGHSRSHMMRGLADADALAVVPAGGLPAGAQVQCLEVPGAAQGGRPWDV